MAEVSFGEWLKRRRGAEGWTQKQLAQQINCSISALRKMEAEERRPSALVIERLAEIFNIPTDEYKSFLRFARGDWQDISIGGQADAPWKVSQAKATHRSNLPVSTSSFIGREKEKDEIVHLIGKSRLVTLTGVGGIGKSRLSVQTASTLLNDFPDGIWLIELAPISDPALVPQTVVNTLGLIEQANRTPQVILTDFLKTKKALLVLDNCEHLIQACAQLAEALLQSCSNLHILATSREVLGISGETVYRVPTLTTPNLQYSALESLSQYEAVQLFIERTQATIHDFSLTQANASAISQICHHLDGIPLALELAAARVKLLRVEEIAARLDDRFHLLTSGSRTALPRHQTLQALIDWSHDLLSENERLLLRHLSVFAGGWTLEAAESVGGDENIQKHEMLDLLTQLVNKSLILAERKQGQETRYHMLETIRQYAREKLWAAGEGESMRQRHLAYFVDLAERAEPNLRAFDMVMWLDRLEAEQDNIRLALEHALESDIEAELRVASALLWFWHIRGHRNEGIGWLEQGLSIEVAERGDRHLNPSHTMIRGKALNASGILSGIGLEVEKATARLEESLELFQKLGPTGKRGAAHALLFLGEFSTDSNRAGMLKESLTLFREVGDRFGVAESLGYLADSALKNDDYNQAVILAEENLALRRDIGDQDGIASALGGLADLAFMKGDYQRTITLCEESLAIFRKLGNKWAQCLTLSSYGDICLWQGNYERAIEIYEEAFAFAQGLGDRFLIAVNVYGLGVIAWFQGNYAQATQKITNSLTLFRDMGHEWLTASSLHSLGDIALAIGDDKSAAQWYEAELAVGRGIEFNMCLAFAFCGLGKLAWVQGNDELATKRFEEGLKVGQEADLKTAMFHTQYGLGRVAQSQGNYFVARSYYAAMLGMQQRRISPPSWYWLKNYGCTVAYPIEAFAVLAAAQNQ